MAESTGVPAAESGTKPQVEDPHLVKIESTVTSEGREAEEETLWDVLRRIATGVFPADGGALHTSPPLVRRIRASLAENTPRLRGACRSTGRDLLLWARQGSALRALLLISVGTITLVALTGLLLFTLFFLAATFNAIVVSFLMSLAAAGGFLALFFFCLTAVYIGALLIAVFIISTTITSAIIAVLVATGWIGFLLIVWVFAKKSVGVAKHSLSMTGSALSAYSAAHRVRHQLKKDD